MPTEPSKQLRLAFTAPSRAQTLLLSLSGMTVVVTPTDGDNELATAHLGAVGLSPTIDPARGPVVNIQGLWRLAELPDHISLHASDELAVLLELVRNQPLGGAPVVVTLDTPDTLNLSWPTETIECNEPFPVSSAAALLALEVPLVAHQDAWDALIAATNLPVVLARARVNLDGFVELSSPVPHRLEVAPIPGLFRIDDTHFGVPLALAGSLDAMPGVLWDSPKPSADPPPAQLTALPFELSDHAEQDLRKLVDALATSRGQAVVWDRGLGRRVFCLAAVETLEALPLLVVTQPENFWTWHRHLDLVGRRPTISHDRGDVHLVTYRDLASRARLPSPGAVLFDDLDHVQQRAPQLLAHLHRLDGLLGACRIASMTALPDEPDAQLQLLSVVRPVEFSADIPAVLRYPGQTEQRLEEHVRCYVNRRSHQTASAPAFPRSTTEVLSPPQSLLDALDAARRDQRPADALLAEVLEIVSAGATHAAGPKVARAAELLRDAAADGRRAVAVCRHERTSRLIAAMLRPEKVETTTGATPTQDRAVVHLSSRSTVDLRTYDTVVVVDYPLSLSTVEETVGRAGDTGIPQLVVLLHLAGTVDDRLAVLAALRHERGTVADADAPLSDDEIRYLLRELAD